MKKILVEVLECHKSRGSNLEGNDLRRYWTIWLYHLWHFNFFVKFGVREDKSWEKQNNKIKKNYIYQF
jgi:hypothetical protein